MSVKSLGKHTNDARLVSPEQCLRDCLADVGKARALEHGTKLLVIALDDRDGRYEISWNNAGLKMSEALGLLEVVKATFLNEMGYNAVRECDLYD